MSSIGVSTGFVECFSRFVSSGSVAARNPCLCSRLRSDVEAAFGWRGAVSGLYEAHRATRQRESPTTLLRLGATPVRLGATPANSTPCSRATDSGAWPTTTATRRTRTPFTFLHRLFSLASNDFVNFVSRSRCSSDSYHHRKHDSLQTKHPGVLANEFTKAKPLRQRPHRAMPSRIDIGKPPWAVPGQAVLSDNVQQQIPVLLLDHVLSQVREEHIQAAAAGKFVLEVVIADGTDQGRACTAGADRRD